MSVSTFNIVTIEWGGLRGIVSLRILQKAEEITGKSVLDAFDMVAGDAL